MRSVNRVFTLAAFVLAVAALTGGVGSQSQYVSTMTFQDGVAPTAGYAGCEATYITAKGDSGKNFGAHDTMYVSSAAYTGYHAGINKVLIKFNIADLPDSAVIVRARLWMYQFTGATGSNSDSIAVYRCFPPWTEGTGTGAAGTASVVSVTWTTRHVNDSPADVYTGGGWFTAGASARAGGTSGAAWSAIDSSVTSTYTGGDTVDVKASESANYDTNGMPVISRFRTGAGASNPRGWVIVDVTRQVHLWHTGANTNNGFVVEQHNVAASSKVFKYASDNWNTAINGDDPKLRRPKLIVDYVDPETLEGSGGGGAVRRIVGGR